MGLRPWTTPGDKTNGIESKVLDSAGGFQNSIEEIARSLRFPVFRKYRYLRYREAEKVSNCLGSQTKSIAKQLGGLPDIGGKETNMSEFHGSEDANGMLTEWETCSWCTEEVLDASLTEQEDGSRVCEDCADDEKTKVVDHWITKWSTY